MAANIQRSYPRRTPENWERAGKRLKHEFSAAGLHEDPTVADFDFIILAEQFYSSYKNWVAEQDRENGPGPNGIQYLWIDDLFAYTNIFNAIPYVPFHIWFVSQAYDDDSEAQLRTLIGIFKMYMFDEDDLYDQRDNGLGRLVEEPDNQHEIVDHLVEEPAETNLPRAQGGKRSRSRKRKRPSKVKKVRRSRSRSHKRKKTKTKRKKTKKQSAKRQR